MSYFFKITIVFVLRYAAVINSTWESIIIHEQNTQGIIVVKESLYVIKLT